QRLFGPDDAAVAESDEEHTEHRHCRPVGGRRNALALEAQHRQDDRSSDGPSASGHDQRRNRLNGDPNSEICRAPEQAHRYPGEVSGPFGSGRQIARIGPMGRKSSSKNHTTPPPVPAQSRSGPSPLLFAVIAVAVIGIAGFAFWRGGDTQAEATAA